jgi:hypothetical protein
MKILRIVAGLTLVAATGCQTLPSPGCVEYATTQVAEYTAGGWKVASVGPAGAAADYVVFIKPDATTVTVETWISRMDGSDPDDAALEADGFARTTTCTWDGGALPAGIGPDGTFWKRVTTQPLPVGGKL